MNNKNIVVAVLISICLICLIMGVFIPSKNRQEKEFQSYAENQNFGKLISSQFSDKISVINLDGIISADTENSYFISQNNATSVLKNLVSARKDNQVKGIVLKINSPGGTVGMSQMIYDEIMRTREVKPVLAVLLDTAASGGYYVASASDRIMALPGTMTGSIGVIMSTMDLHKLLNEKLSISENVIKSGKFKDIGSSSRAMTDDERALLQDIVNDSFSQFKEAIKKGRVERKDEYSAVKTVLTNQNLDKYADGRVFTGKKAVELGFVDMTGSGEDYENVMKSMVKDKFGIESDLEFVNYVKNGSFFDMLMMDTSSKSFVDSFLPSAMKYSRQPLYLWE